MSEHPALDALADAYGIARNYFDVRGQEYRPPVDALRAILWAMGVPAIHEDEARDSLEYKRQREACALLPPVTVARHAAQPVQVTVRTAPEASRLRFDVVTEHGERHSGEHVWRDLTALGSIDHNREPRALPLPVLPEGYHTLGLEVDGAQATMPVIVTPASCPSVPGGRALGIAVQAYGLRAGAQAKGIGDFADIRRLATTFGQSGIDLLGLNPMHALFWSKPEHISPYSPSSRLALNPLYLPVEDAAHGDAGDLIDYPAVHRAKNDALRRAFMAADKTPLEPFAAERPQLYRFAVFEALTAHLKEHGDPHWGYWRFWPEQWRHPDHEAVARFADEHAAEVLYHLWLQQRAEHELAGAQRAARAAGMRLGLYRDLAIGVDPSGADAWSNQAVIGTGISVGAPPDPFAADGQNWGLAPLDPHALRHSGYKFFIEALRANLRHAGALRIDHILGLMRLFWIPHDFAGKDGAYVAYPFEDLLGLLALEAKRHSAVVIGEDLGTVPEGLRDRLAEANVLGCRVMMFERQDGGAFTTPRHYGRAASASFGTHDLATLAGYWQGRDIDWRGKLAMEADPAGARRERAEERRRLLRLLRDEGVLPPGLDADNPPDVLSDDLDAAIHALLAHSPAPIVLAQLEDVLGLVEQPNLPGTIDEHPNWRRRYPVTVEQIAEHPRVQKILAALRSGEPAH